MRIFVSVVLALVFVPAFLAFVLADALVRQAADSTAVVQAARRSDARATVISVMEHYLARELGERPHLQEISRVELRAALEAVVTEDWVEQEVASVHRALRGTLELSDAPTVVELEPVKQALRDAAAKLVERARTRCRDLFPAARCDDQLEAAGLTKELELQARTTIGELPDQLDLLEGLPGRDRTSAGLARLQRAVGLGRLVHWGGLGLLLLLLLGIVLINLDSPARALLLAGAPLFVAAGLFLVVAGTAVGPVRELARSELTHATGDAQLTPIQAATARGAERFGLELTLDALRRPRVPIAITAGAGLLVLGAGFAVSRRGR